MMGTSSQTSAMRSALLDWYDASGRTLPWRVRPEDRARGVTPDPYAVWLSEIMLQQTTVPHGTPYWHKFLSLYPSVTDLAAAALDDVLTHWAGLGYYARARNLHKCAQIVTAEHGGTFPNSRAELLKLPGIGDYTASTIAAICFDEATNIVDGNVERVIARVYRVETPMPKAKPRIKALAAPLADPDRPGDYGQALMDLGATVCTPKSPSCGLCVWAEYCAARAHDDVLSYPVRKPKTALPIRYGHAYVMTRGAEVFLRRRDEAGLLGGMMEVPGSEWEGVLSAFSPPAAGDWQRDLIQVRHVFTHFELRLQVHRAELSIDPDCSGRWVQSAALTQQALPTLFKKVLAILD